MAKFKKLNKAHAELQERLTYLNALIATQAVKNGGQLIIPFNELEDIKNKYISIEKEDKSFIVTISTTKINP